MPSGGGWRLCGLGRLIAAAACACVLMSPRPATAAIGAPATLCRTFTPGATDVDASAASRLAEEAGRAEQALATSGESVPEFTPRSLDLPPGAPSPAARAAYCSAIGELARRGAFGNPLDAPGYLHVAFQYAEQARADALTARVAYRLGLSLTGETSISRKHASLIKSGSDVTVSDLGSTNGTFVNGAKLQAATLLRPGDTVQFGAVSFRYQA